MLGGGECGGSNSVISITSFPKKGQGGDKLTFLIQCFTLLCRCSSCIHGRCKDLEDGEFYNANDWQSNGTYET